MPSNHLILYHPLLLLPSIFPSIRVFSNESALCMRWPKCWRFSFNISSFNKHPGLISFRMDHPEIPLSLISKLPSPYWRRQWHPTPVLLPGKSHGQRSLVGCRLCSYEGLDTTERLPFHFSLSCIGEGNGNPLQCSCLENPRDGGAWWAAVYGVVQSRTRLK